MTTIAPLVLVPGFMGSELTRKDQADAVWVHLGWALGHLPSMIADLDLRGPAPVTLTPNGPLDTIPLDGIVHFDVYQTLRQWALATTTYGLSLPATDYYEFGYDWRLSVDTSAAALDRLLQGIPGTTPVTVLAHSQGGLVVSKLFAQGGPGSSRVGKVIAIGCPFAGLLKTIDMIQSGSGVLSILFKNDPIRTLLQGMPGAYELMPWQPGIALLTDNAGRPVTPSQGLAAVPLFDKTLLQGAETSVGSLSLALPVPLRLIEGFGKQTATAGCVYGAEVTITRTIEGDGTCPADSLHSARTASTQAGAPDVRQFSVPFCDHVRLVQHPGVLAYLKEELTPGLAHAPQFNIGVQAAVRPPDSPNVLVVETRDPDGGPLGASPVSQLPNGTPIVLDSDARWQGSRWVGTFQHPTLPGLLSVTVPGLGRRTVLLA